MRINPSSDSLTPVTNTSIDDEHIPDSKKSLVDNSSPFRSWTKYYSSDSLPQSIELTRVLIHTVITRLATTFLNLSSWTMKVIKWKPTSSEELEVAETKLLSYLQSPYKGYYVNIGSGWGLDNNDVWTVEMNGPSKKWKKQKETSETESKTENLPLVLIHGFGCGTGIWSLNYDSLAAHRKVYAFDVLGFGRSSRPRFAKSELVEHELVESIERWRRAVGLNQKFILLGHSFGGYLSLAYALRYPTFISRVILADPWGIPSSQTASSSTGAQVVIPTWVKFVARLVFQTFSPLAVLRAAGPWGPGLVHKTRPDIKKKFEALTGEADSGLVLDYVYHCNAQSPPSGELAFKTLAGPTGWAKNPMIQRVTELEPHIDLTFIYGSRSWIDRQPGIQIKHLLSERSVQVHVIQGAGHHVYVDKLDIFNNLVNTTCKEVDEEMAKDRQKQVTESLYDQD